MDNADVSLLWRACGKGFVFDGEESTSGVWNMFEMRADGEVHIVDQRQPWVVRY